MLHLLAPFERLKLGMDDTASRFSRSSASNKILWVLQIVLQSYGFHENNQTYFVQKHHGTSILNASLTTKIMDDGCRLFLHEKEKNASKTKDEESWKGMYCIGEHACTPATRTAVHTCLHEESCHCLSLSNPWPQNFTHINTNSKWVVQGVGPAGRVC